jgi:choline-sulfatase
MQYFHRFLLILILVNCSVAANDPKIAAHKASKESQAPNIILITIDTTRADRMGFLGSGRGLTPNLDTLAKESVIFTRAYAQVPLTTPSHAVLLTGTYPQFNHVEDLGSPLRGDLPDLPVVLHEHGYQTAAFIGAIILDPKNGMAPGFDRGFDLYDGDFHHRRPGENRYLSQERRAGDVAAHALGWLSSHSRRPFFAWLHFFDPHDPYDPPPPFRERYASALYDGEIAYTDSVIGNFFQALRRRNLFENCVVAIVADHGEAFGEHGEERHGVLLYDETVHVPMLLKLPSKRFSGTRVQARVGLVDVAPSLLHAAGINPPAAMQGQSVFPLIETASSFADKTAKDEADRAIYSESNYAHRYFGWSELHSWRTGKYLYVRAPKRELYDQSVDAQAIKNLSSSSEAVTETLDAQLTSFLHKTSSGQRENLILDPSQAEKLRALGYLASATAHPTSEDVAAIDPKDKIEVANRFHHDLVDMEEDRYDQAIADLRDLAADERDIPTIDLELGQALFHQGQYREAVPVLRSAAEKDPTSPFPHYQLGLTLIQLEQFSDALQEMKAAAACTPNSAQYHYYVGSLETRMLNLAEAEKEYEKAVELDPNYFDAYLSYGRVLLMEGHVDAALVKLVQAVKLRPQSAEAHSSLAEGYTQIGQTAKANRERALAKRLTEDTDP